jgi:hypothetical protein
MAMHLHISWWCSRSTLISAMWWFWSIHHTPWICHHLTSSWFNLMKSLSKSDENADEAIEKWFPGILPKVLQM